MKKICKKIKNWCSLLLCKNSTYDATLNWYKFTPTEDITAYELYYSRPYTTIQANNPDEAQRKMKEFYNNLPPQCKKYWVPCVISVTFYKEFEDQ